MISIMAILMAHQPIRVNAPQIILKIVASKFEFLFWITTPLDDILYPKNITYFWICMPL